MRQGRDKTIAKLIDLARRKKMGPRDAKAIPSLARLCAEAIVSSDPLDYQQAEAGAAAVVSDILLEKHEGKESQHDDGSGEEAYTFDAYLCMLCLREYRGESLRDGDYTTGCMVKLYPGDPPPPSELSGGGSGDLQDICEFGGDATHDGVLAGIDDEDFDDYGNEEEVALRFIEDGVVPSPDWMDKDMRIYANELLLADHDVYYKKLKDMATHHPDHWTEDFGVGVSELGTDMDLSGLGAHKEVEFLGNGGTPLRACTHTRLQT